MTPPNIFRFGVFSDVQFADCDDGPNYQNTRKRFYRQALLQMDAALASWEVYSSKPEVDAILNAGDVLDGRCCRLGQTETALAALEQRFSRLRVPIYNVVGNHELYNIKRKDILDSFLYRPILSSLPGEAFSQQLIFYDFSPLPGYRLVILDSFDVSCLGLSPGDSRFLSAEALLRSKNSNKDLNDSTGLTEPQFCLYNGGIGSQQLNWLKTVLTRSAQLSESVIIVSHAPLDPYDHRFDKIHIWNSREVLGVLHRFSSTVKLVLCGHTHEFGQWRDAGGILHLTMPSLLETPKGEVATAVMELTGEGIRILGDGGIVPDMNVK